MAGRSKAIRLSDRDYRILQDIYEFYYIDYHAAKLRYWKVSEKPEVSRTGFNKRMLSLVREGLIAPVAFHSARRKGRLGGSDLAYTLTKAGVQLLEDVYERELEWDTSRKDRKNIYIQHHVGVLYYVLMYSALMDAGKVAGYYGEQSSRYQRAGKDNLLKDHIKPDGTMVFREGDQEIPWFVEYERNSNASRTTIKSKLINYSEYAQSGSYRQHDVMLQHDHPLPPVLVFLCETQHVLNRRRLLIAENKIAFYFTAQQSGFGDLLFALQSEVEEDPYGFVYERFAGERVSLNQINQVQVIGKLFQDSRFEKLDKRVLGLTYTWYPASVASQSGIKLDGIVGLKNEARSAAFLVRYIPEALPEKDLLADLQALVTYKEQEKERPHRIIGQFSSNSPVLLLIAERPEQEDRLLQAIDQFGLEHKMGWRCFVSRLDLLNASQQPYGPHWRSADSSSRIEPL